MTYRFKPLTDDEIEQSSLLESGIYKFSVLKSNRKVSKSGNDMAEIQLSIYSKEGVYHTVFDYLVFSNVPLNIRKVKHFCDSVGLVEDYKKGELPEMLDSYSGEVEISIKDGQPNPNGGFYSKKNVVVDYIKSNEVSFDNKNDDKNKFKEDELPF